MAAPTSILSRELLPASIAIYTTVALAAFEGLAVSAALPQVAADLGDVHLLPFVVTGYMLMSGVATVVSGPLVDGLGVRTVFRVGVVVFVAGAVLASFAPTMPLMIAARLIHGAGGGLVIAVAVAAVALVYPEHLIGRAFAANSTIWGVMGVAGPGIAALMLTSVGWRWIFLVNIPLGLISLAAGWRVMPERVAGNRARRLDIIGAVGVLAFNALLLVGVNELGTASLLWLGGAAAVGVAMFFHVRRRPDPIMRLRHIGSRPFAPLAATLALHLAGAISISTYITLYVRGGRGASETLTAWSVFFFVLGWTSGSNLSSRMLDRMPETSVMGIGLALTVPGLAVLAVLIGADVALGWILAVMVVTALGVGLSTNAGLTLLRAVSDPAEIGRSSAAHQFFRNLGFTLGSALGGAIVLAVVARLVGDVEGVRQVLDAGGAADAAVSGAIRRGYAVAALVAFAVSGLAVIPFVSLRRHLTPARQARWGGTA